MECPNCKMKIADDSNFCIHCGKQLKEKQQIVEDDKERAIQEKKHNRNIIILSISSVNLFVIFPVALTFGGLWAIFGAFTNNALLYYGLLILWAIYFILSILIPIIYLVRVLSKSAFSNKKQGKVVSIIVTVIFLLVMTILFIYWKKYFH